MRIVVVSALLAMSALCSMAAPNLQKAPLAIYYSFDTPPSAGVLKEMRTELGRILVPSGVWATWLRADDSSELNENFPGIVVLRFSGRCGFEDLANTAPDPAGKALAETDTNHGHVLPFSKVNCERVRNLIAPTMKAMPPDWKSQSLGRALARVAAHEIYHMLAGVEVHSDRGIFQAADSREDLTAATFSFAAPENEWLRRWMRTQDSSEQIANSSSEPSGPEPVASESVGFGPNKDETGTANGLAGR